MLHELKLNYYGKDVGSFDPEKILVLIANAFPKTIIDPVDWAQKEVDGVIAYTTRAGISAKIKGIMIRQIRGKQRRNGPVYNFSLKLGKADIRGLVSRYSLRFESRAPLPKKTNERILSFLKTLKMGIPEIVGI